MAGIDQLKALTGNSMNTVVDDTDAILAQASFLPQLYQIRAQKATADKDIALQGRQFEQSKDEAEYAFTRQEKEFSDARQAEHDAQSMAKFNLGASALFGGAGMAMNAGIGTKLKEAFSGIGSKMNTALRESQGMPFAGGDMPSGPMDFDMFSSGMGQEMVA